MTLDPRFSTLNFAEPSTFTGKVKILRLEPKNAGTQWVTIEGLNGHKVIAWIKEDSYAVPIAEGAEAECEIEVKREEYTTKAGNPAVSHKPYINWFGAPVVKVTTGKDGKKSSYTPRTPSHAEIHGLPIATIIAAYARANGSEDLWAKDLARIKQLVNLYYEAVKGPVHVSAPAATPAATTVQIPFSASVADAEIKALQSADYLAFERTASDRSIAFDIRWNELSTAIHELTKALPPSRLFTVAIEKGVTSMAELVAFADETYRKILKEFR